ncbi:peptidylprolyl isomerase [Prochlorococcus marinus XMU1411]|uniref:peptidylprolyl isomerase n=1 Tax=Prochlorococcus marinus TaxID=1219 RepID=UPI001ADD5F1D|nr:peptidylprolyl isomerase [Prochlorococcus marinus]MBO8242886.1 peptidylprolyl isomerase [Prochlorococcus marinus XMU1411]MBW3054005.1 peptidylprolyl isomerase [Prochlorococcus marinus str. MU1411]MCR8537575.1 peptidylprolyl isomerase [Prochlorococcus marinus CUG1430]
MQKFLSNQNKVFLILLIVFSQVFLFKPIQVLADLPTGNAVKDPNAILRNALPIKQVELQEIQHKLEETSDLVRGGRWPALAKTVTKCQSLLKKYQSKIIQELPKDKQKITENTFLELKENFNSLQDYSKSKDKYSFIATRRDALDKIGKVEEYFLPNEFPYSIPHEFDNLPRLLGRAKVNIKTSKGDMQAIVDGFNAPLTAGAFIDLSSKNFYKDLPINRAEEFFVMQTGDPIGEAIGYIDPETNEERHVPLEIRIPDEKDTFYNQTFEDLGFYTETPTLPFATLGTLGWSHSNTAVDDGSSQFFFFLYEAELNPAGRNLIDGRNAAFGYVVDGFDVLEELTKDDTIISIDVLEGIENLQLNA